MRTNEAVWMQKHERWQIKVQKEGTRKSFYSKTKGKKGKIEAERKADEWLNSNNADDARLGELWEEFLSETLKLTSNSNYINLKSLGENWILPILKYKRLSKIVEQDWQTCINKAAEKGKSKRTCGNIRGAITAFYRYAKKRGIKIVRPEDIAIPKSTKVGERKILQPADLKILFSKSSIRRYGKEQLCFYIHAWRFMVLTGLRRGELCGLKNEDIVGNIVYIKRSINRLNEVTTGKTDAARRYFVLNDTIGNVLKEQEAMLKKQGIISEYVFPDEYAEMTEPAHLYKKWFTYRKHHNINCSLHELRHTLISIAKADVPEQLLKRAVGHTKNTDTFGIYGHDIDGEMGRVANILDGIFKSLLK